MQLKHEGGRDTITGDMIFFIRPHLQRIVLTTVARQKSRREKRASVKFLVALCSRAVYYCVTKVFRSSSFWQFSLALCCSFNFLPPLKNTLPSLYQVRGSSFQLVNQGVLCCCRFFIDRTVCSPFPRLEISSWLKCSIFTPMWTWPRPAAVAAPSPPPGWRRR